MPYLFVLVGIPGSGKSTWIAQQPFDWNNTVVASTDNHIEKYARDQQSTYSKVFKDYMPTAVQKMSQDVADAIRDGKNIIWDQTNTTVGSRIKKIKSVPDNYTKIAVVFVTPDDKELLKRLSGRPGKEIPAEVIKQMKSSLQLPTKEEGFDHIYTVST